MRDVLRAQLEFGANSLLHNTKDVTNEEAAQRPNELAPIVWQVGHLALYDHKLLAQLEDDAPTFPEQYEALFQMGSSGADELPPLSEVMPLFEAGQAGLLRIVETDLTKPLEGGPLYTTVGGALAFTHYHRGYHTGKITSLRSLLGKTRST